MEIYDQDQDFQPTVVFSDDVIALVALAEGRRHAAHYWLDRNDFNSYKLMDKHSKVADELVRRIGSVGFDGRDVIEAEEEATVSVLDLDPLELSLLGTARISYQKQKEDAERRKNSVFARAGRFMKKVLS